MKNKIKLLESNKTVQKSSFILNSDWMTRYEASRYLKVGISTLDTCIPVKKYYIGKSVRYHKKDLDEYLFSNCVEPQKGGRKNGK